MNPAKPMNLDPQQVQSFLRYYKSLPKKTAATVRFFTHNEFYSVHGEDTTLANESQSMTVIKQMNDDDKTLPYVCLNQQKFDKFVRDLLLVRQYRVEVYSKQGKNDWKLEYKGSPGNLQQFEDILFDNTDAIVNGAVMGIKVSKGNLLGVSCVNSMENTFQVTEFTDNEFYTELEALIAQVSPKECVIPVGNNLELTRLRKILERSNILVVTFKKTEFSMENVEQDLNRLLYFEEDQKRSAATLKETSLTDAMESLQAVIKYLNLVGEEGNFNQFKLKGLDIKRYVRLDAAAINALNLLNKPGVVGNKFDTVYGVLNSCSTPQGKRLLEKWMKQPLNDINAINERLDVVEQLVNDSECRNNISSYVLNKMLDLMMLAKKLLGAKANLQDCYKIYQTVNAVPNLINSLKKIEGASVRGLLINPLSDAYESLSKFVDMIDCTLDMEFVDRGEFYIKPSFDEELNDLYEQRQSVKDKMDNVFYKAAKDLGLELGKTIKLDSTDQHGYFFRVTLKEEPILRSNKKYEIIDAIKGGCRFTNSDLRHLNEKYSELNEVYEKQQSQAVEKIIEIARGYTDVIRTLNQCIATVDVLVSFAYSASSAPVPFVRPKMHAAGTGIIKLKNARHPCLERQDGINFIPNDIDFKQGERNFFIITGPNMGGKSTYMRTIGVSVYMAHIGSFVPCDKAKISIVDCILARVGADDCELKGLSTFMLEMVETCGIIRSATSNSLVIIDELGRGTSTYDGCGIAWSIAEYLVKDASAFTLFATHYHEITHLEDELPGVKNVHVAALITDENITPLYQVKEGICDKSYGIHCARIVKFPQDVIDFAVEHQNKLEDSAGLKYIKNFEVGVKRKIIEEADQIIASKLSGLKDFDVENATDEEILAKVNRLTKKLKNSGNKFIEGLIEA